MSLGLRSYNAITQFGELMQDQTTTQCMDAAASQNDGPSMDERREAAKEYLRAKKCYVFDKPVRKKKVTPPLLTQWRLNRVGSSVAANKGSRA